MTPQPDDEFHVLTDALDVTVGLEQVLAAEQPERPGDQQIAAQPVPARTTEQEGAEVLDRLDAGRRPDAVPARRPDGPG